MADEIKQQIMQLVQADPQLVEQVRGMVQELAADPDVEPGEIAGFIADLESVIQNPASYPDLVQRLESEGIADPGDLPSQFDPMLIVALLAAFYLLQDQVGSGEQAFARGGLARMAQEVRAAGRNGDTILAHITPEEARMLKAAGGSGTINPATGLREYGLKKFLKKAIKVLAPVALAIFAPGIGAAIGGALGLSGTAAAVAGNALVSGTVSKLSGGDFVQGAIGGAIGGGLGNVVGSAANTALGAGLGSTGQAVLGNAITGAAQAAATGGNILKGAIGGGLSGAGGSLGGFTGSALQGAGQALGAGGDIVRGALSGLAGLGGRELGGSLASSLDLGGAGTGALQGALSQAGAAGAMGGDAGRALAQGAASGAAMGSGIGQSLLATLRGGMQRQQPSQTQASLGPAMPEQAGGVGQLEGIGQLGQPPLGQPSMEGTQLASLDAGNGILGRYARGAGIPANRLQGWGGSTADPRMLNVAAQDLGWDPTTYFPYAQVRMESPRGTMGNVPEFDYPSSQQTYLNIAPSVTSVNQRLPGFAANVLTHELAHVGQKLSSAPGEDVTKLVNRIANQTGMSTTAPFGKQSDLDLFNQNINKSLDYINKTYGGVTGYTSDPSSPLFEKLTDLTALEMQIGKDLTQDPYLQKNLFTDPRYKAVYNAMTIPRMTRLDPRDLPTGQVLPNERSWEEKARNFMQGKRYAKGGLAKYKEYVRG